MEGIGRFYLLPLKGQRPAKLNQRSPAVIHNSFTADPEHLIELIHQGALKPYESFNTITKPASPENPLNVSPPTKWYKQER